MKIGSGTFGSVYAATLKQTPIKVFALKHIQPCCSTRRILNEIKHLTLIKSEYVISLETFFRHYDHIVLVMPSFEHDSFQDFFNDLTIVEVQVYMKSLFLAVKALHSHGVIHRDIKPSNVLFNRKSKKLKLIDLGLSQEDPANTNFCSITNYSIVPKFLIHLDAAAVKKYVVCAWVSLVSQHLGRVLQASELSKCF